MNSTRQRPLFLYSTCQAVCYQRDPSLLMYSTRQRPLLPILRVKYTIKETLLLVYSICQRPLLPIPGHDADLLEDIDDTRALLITLRHPRFERHNALVVERQRRLDGVFQPQLLHLGWWGQNRVMDSDRDTHASGAPNRLIIYVYGPACVCWWKSWKTGGTSTATV